MRIARWRLIAFAIVALAAMTAQATLAQTADADRPDPIRLPPDGQPLRIERAEEIPRQLKSAINRRCRPDDWMAMGLPVEIFRPASGSRPMALVPCGMIVAFHLVFVFERTLGHEPSVMQFPAIAHGGGFTASEHVGLINWNPDSRTLTAVQHTDVCVGRIPRHTYRHQGAGGLNGFVLVRVEHAPACDPRPEDWTTLWEARPWDIPK